jgi:hypothetical protein
MPAKKPTRVTEMAAPYDQDAMARRAIEAARLAQEEEDRRLAEAERRRLATRQPVSPVIEPVIDAPTPPRQPIPTPSPVAPPAPVPAPLPEPEPVAAPRRPGTPRMPEPAEVPAPVAPTAPRQGPPPVEPLQPVTTPSPPVAPRTATPRETPTPSTPAPVAPPRRLQKFLTGQKQDEEDWQSQVLKSQQRFRDLGETRRSRLNELVGQNLFQPRG